MSLSDILFVIVHMCLTSQSTIFQQGHDGPTASCVFINQYHGEYMCLAQRHNQTPVGFKPLNYQSRVWTYYVLCNPPFPHTHTRGGRGRTGDSRGNEQGFDQILPRQCWGNTRGLLYISKGPLNEKTVGCRGKLQWFYQRAVPAGWGF